MATNGSHLSDDPIGVIGAGRLGQAFARVARRAGRDVLIANRRGPASLAPVVDLLGSGVAAVTTQEAASCPIVALAVPWISVRDALVGLTWSGQIVVDATNAVLIPSLEMVELGETTSSEIVAQLIPGARLVKAANTLGSDVLGGDPNHVGGQRVLFLSGDDEPAKRVVQGLLAAAGFYPIDLGGLLTGGVLHGAGGPLARHDLVRMPAPGERANA